MNDYAPKHPALPLPIPALGGCGSGVSGTFTDSVSGNQWSFDGGELAITNSGMSKGGHRYEPDSDKIRLSAPGGVGRTLENNIKHNGCPSGAGIPREACKS